MYISTTTQDAATPVFSAPALTRAAALSAPYILKSGTGETLERWSSLIGIVTAIVGNILISFALNIQRYAHIRLHEENSRREKRFRSISKSLQNGYGTTDSNGRVNEINRQDGEEDNSLPSSYHSQSSQLSGCSDQNHTRDSTYLKSPYWWGGIALMTIGEAGNFLAYGFAPASIVSPLGVVALISNCVIAPIMLKERFRLRDFWGVLVAVGGAVTVVLSAKQDEKKLGPHQIWEAITRTEFEVYMAVTIAMIGVLIWASPKYGNKTILIDLGLVGLFGGYTALSTKGVASMLSSTLWRALTTPVTYALLAVLVGTAVMQVKYVNKALQRFDSTQVIPVQFVMFTLSVIVGSAVLYRDFEKATTESGLKFVGGCLLTFFGVWLITSGRPSRVDDESDMEDSDEEGEERIGLHEQDPAEGQNMHTESRRPDIVRRRTQSTQNGEGTNDDEAIADSRRSSRVSFVDTSPQKPRTPRMYSSSSSQPSIRVSDDNPEEMPLLSNPWKNSSDDLLQAARHPALHSTISSPVLPTEATSSSDSLKPPATPRTTSQANFHTHPNHQQSPALPQADRPMTPARHSMSRMLPGPLLSPLSGGLSVVVADSLRRGMDNSLRKSFRRPRLGLRRTKSGSQRLSYGLNGDEELGTSPLKDSELAQQDTSKSLGTNEESSNSWGRTRARSLSNTLGDLFRGKRQKSREPEEEPDYEADPSRS